MAACSGAAGMQAGSPPGGVAAPLHPISEHIGAPAAPPQGQGGRPAALHAWLGRTLR